MLDSHYGRRQQLASPPPFDTLGNPTTYTHSRTPTASSSTFSHLNYNSIQQPPAVSGAHHMQMQMRLFQPQSVHQRRSPSVNTFSTVSSGGGSSMAPPNAYRTSPSATDIRRSISSRSGNGASPQSTSYVALLRKQKATVWSDRAQYEDPRLQAAQRAAKMRANLEVVGNHATLAPGSSGGRTSTGLSSSAKITTKIRHHGKPTVVGYSPESNYIGVGGVPLRLSATEVEGEDSDEDDAAAARLHHRRTGSSGRSSTASRRATGLIYRTSGPLNNWGSQGKRWSPGNTPERSRSLVIEEIEATGGTEDSASGKARSFASGSSCERLDSVPDMDNTARLATKSLMNAALTREKSVKNADDLRRRGSVDERSATLTSGRLYIANPD